MVITGTNFTGVTAVTIGGTAAASFVVNSLTQITASVGARATGTIAVTTCGGTAKNVGTFTVNHGPTAFAVTGGTACASVGVTIGTANSTTGVNDQMFLNGVATGPPVGGSTGSPVPFGLQNTAGVYTVIGTAAG